MNRLADWLSVRFLGIRRIMWIVIANLVMSILACLLLAMMPGDLIFSLFSIIVSIMMVVEIVWIVRKEYSY